MIAGAAVNELGLSGITTTTVSARVIDMLNPRIEDIDLGDIACGLSRTCRYSGQIRRFFSVAEHSVWCAQEAAQAFDLDLARAALMHDAAEAYVGDLVRPLKMALRADGIASAYDEIEAAFAAAIGKRFDLPEGYDSLPEVKRIDTAACAREMQTLRDMPGGWKPRVTPLAFWPQCWDPLTAEVKFIETAKLLGVR